MRFIFVAILSIALTACATTSTNIIRLKNQSYRMTTSSKTNGESLRVATKKADQFCRKQHLRLVLTNLKSNYLSIYVPKNFTYHTSINFVCAPALKEAV